MQQIDDYFDSKIRTLPFEEPLKAYIAGVLKQYVSSKNDLSNQSITLLYIKANNEMNFALFQNIADWSFWMGIFKHQMFNEHKTLYNVIASDCYRKCNIIMRNEWELFAVMSKNFPGILEQTRKSIVQPSKSMIDSFHVND